MCNDWNLKGVLENVSDSLMSTVAGRHRDRTNKCLWFNRLTRFTIIHFKSLSTSYHNTTGFDPSGPHQVFEIVV
jgi:hypothetical protein